jgi:hypothetical protein
MDGARPQAPPPRKTRADMSEFMQTEREVESLNLSGRQRGIPRL